MSKLEKKVTVQMSQEMYRQLEQLQTQTEYGVPVGKAAIVRHAIQKFIDSKK